MSRNIDDAGGIVKALVFEFTHRDEERVADLTFNGVIDSKIARGDYREVRPVACEWCGHYVVVLGGLKAAQQHIQFEEKKK